MNALLDFTGWVPLFCSAVGLSPKHHRFCLPTCSICTHIWYWIHVVRFPGYSALPQVSVPFLPTLHTRPCPAVTPVASCCSSYSLLMYDYYHKPSVAIGVITSGWWFGTFVYFPRNIGCLIIPIDELIFFRGVAQPPTSITCYTSSTSEKPRELWRSLEPELNTFPRSIIVKERPFCIFSASVGGIWRDPRMESGMEQPPHWWLATPKISPIKKDVLICLNMLYELYVDYIYIYLLKKKKNYKRS